MFTFAYKRRSGERSPWFCCALALYSGLKLGPSCRMPGLENSHSASALLAPSCALVRSRSASGFGPDELQCDLGEVEIRSVEAKKRVHGRGGSLVPRTEKAGLVCGLNQSIKALISG